MATLEDFLKAGRLGPVNLGMGPVEAMTALGDPDDTSEKINPLIMRYGPVELMFASKPGQRKQDLREITVLYKPRFRKMHRALRLSDWSPSRAPTVNEFLGYLDEIRYPPVHRVSGESGTQLIFMSGVVARFVDKVLHSIRLSQRETKEDQRITVSDEREPSPTQILEMLAEADRALEANAPRAALMTAWAGLEAALRRAVLRAGGQGRIGVAPVVLLRELFSEKELSEDDYGLLETVRQVRTSAAHGLAPAPIQRGTINRLKSITQRLLGPSLRKQMDVGYIWPVEAIEAYSVLANTKHARLLADFLHNKGLKVDVKENVIGGDDPQHDIQIQKDVDFATLNKLIGDWKSEYQHSV